MYVGEGNRAGYGRVSRCVSGGRVGGGVGHRSISRGVTGSVSGLGRPCRGGSGGGRRSGHRRTGPDYIQEGRADHTPALIAFVIVHTPPSKEEDVAARAQGGRVNI